MITILTDDDLKKLSPEDTAFLAGFCAATDSATSFLYNVDVYQNNFDVDGVDINLARFLENHEEVREGLLMSQAFISGQITAYYKVEKMLDELKEV